MTMTNDTTIRATLLFLAGMALIALLAGRLGRRLNESELTHAMLDMDIDGGGEIEFNEFFQWWKRSAGGGKGRNDGSGLKE